MSLYLIKSFYILCKTKRSLVLINSYILLFAYKFHHLLFSKIMRAKQFYEKHSRKYYINF